MPSDMELVPKEIIELFKQPLKLIKKVVFKDTDIESTEKSYETKEITFYGAVIKPKDSEIVVLETMGIRDVVNTHKIYTLYKDIVIEDIVIMNSKRFYIWILNNHFDRAMNYLELFVSEEVRIGA